MISILVAAKKTDATFRRNFSAGLRKNFATLTLGSRRFQAPDRDAQFILCDMLSFDEITSDGCVLIFKGMSTVSIPAELPAQTVAVVDSRDRNLMQQLCGISFPAITCGLSSKDTLTLSSINDDQAVITVQRSILCFDGSLAEPQEIPVRIGTIKDVFTLLSLAAVYILSGNVSGLSNCCF